MTLLLMAVGYLVLLVSALAFNHGANRDTVEAVEPLAVAQSEPISAGLVRSN